MRQCDENLPPLLTSNLKPQTSNIKHQTSNSQLLHSQLLTFQPFNLSTFQPFVPAPHPVFEGYDFDEGGMWLSLNRDIFDVLNIPIRDKNSNSNIPIRDDILADMGLNMLYAFAENGDEAGDEGSELIDTAGVFLCDLCVLCGLSIRVD